MRGKMVSRLLTALIVCLLATVLFGVAASADALEVLPCRECQKEGMTFTTFYATTEWQKISETQCARVYECNNGHRELTYFTDGTYRDTADHVAKANATCTTAAVPAAARSWVPRKPCPERSTAMTAVRSPSPPARQRAIPLTPAPSAATSSRLSIPAPCPTGTTSGSPPGRV